MSIRIGILSTVSEAEHPSQARQHGLSPYTEIVDVPETLSVDQIEALLAQATGPKNGLRNRCMMELMARRGLRVSEVVNIKLRDVRWTEQKITLQETKAGRGKASGRAVVSIPDRTWDLLKQWKNVRSQYAKGSEMLFVTTEKGKEGKKVTRRYIWGMMRRYARRAGIEGPCHPHTLRHSFATNLLQRGADLETVRKAMRHASIQNTQIYLHIVDKDLEDTIKDL